MRTRKRKQTNVDDLVIDVTDSGMGIEERDLPKLFKPFQQLQQEGNEQRGTGLGLALCKSLSALMGGNVGVSSAVGVGARFWLQVPFSRASPSATHDQSYASTLSSEAVLKRGKLAFAPELRKRTRILLVEDNMVNRVVATALVEKLGFSITDTAVCGSEALAKGQANAYDIILMDVQLGDGMDGLEVTRLLRRHAAVKRLNSGARRSSISGVLPTPAAYGTDAPRLPPSPLSLYSQQADPGAAAAVPQTSWMVDDSEPAVIAASAASASVGRRLVGPTKGPTARAVPEGTFERLEPVILAITAGAMKEDVMECFSSGVDGYVAKPIDAVVLFKHFVRALGIDLGTAIAIVMDQDADVEPGAR